MSQLPTELLISFGKSISLQNESKNLKSKAKDLIFYEKNMLKRELKLNFQYPSYNSEIQQNEVKSLFENKNNIHSDYLNYSKVITKKYKNLRKELYIKYPEHKQALNELYKKEDLKRSLNADIINKNKFKIIEHIINFKSLHKTQRNISHPPYGNFESLKKEYFYFELSDNDFREVLNQSFLLAKTIAKYIIENKNDFLNLKNIRNDTRAYLILDSILRDIESIKIHKKLYTIIYELEDLIEVV